MEVIEIRQANQ
jgi:hypothetical protein